MLTCNFFSGEHRQRWADAQYQLLCHHRSDHHHQRHAERAFNSAVGTTSAEQNYSVSGTSLTGAIVITAPADFEISTSSGSGFSS